MTNHVDPDAETPEMSGEDGARSYRVWEQRPEAASPTQTYSVGDQPVLPGLFWRDPEAPGDRHGLLRGRDRQLVLRAGLALMIAALLGAGAGSVASYYALGGKRPAGSVNVVAPPVTGRVPLADNQAAVVAKAVLPSIVQIDVTGVQGVGLGSGVIYRSDGYIVTNAHVVNGADSIEVSLPNGEKLRANVTGSAISSGVDIAVIHVDRAGLPAARFGSIDDIIVGDTAVAIGSPFGLQATVTAGVISALHRDLAQFNIPFSDAIQTDAPINPGNSGGALADSQGKVIGINQAIVGGAGGSVGVGFAIPTDWVLKVADQIIRTGRAQLAFLGIAGDNLPSARGAHIARVAAGGPAQRAGIKPDDVIVSLDGTAVASMNDLIEQLLRKDVGQIVQVGLLRGGKRITVRATLGAKSEG
jgi:S1-C subfamily serine protease